MPIKLSKIKRNPKNPRVIRDKKFQALKESIRTFPEMMQVRKIVVDENWMILCGSQRLAAIKELDYSAISEEWVQRVEGLTPEQKQELMIKDNTHYGEWEAEALANEWDAKSLSDWGVDMPGLEFDHGALRDTSGPGHAPPPADPFQDQGIAGANKYGVIVYCADEAEQESIFGRLTTEGLACKIVVV